MHVVDQLTEKGRNGVAIRLLVDVDAATYNEGDGVVRDKPHNDQQPQPQHPAPSPVSASVSTSLSTNVSTNVCMSAPAPAPCALTNVSTSPRTLRSHQCLHLVASNLSPIRQSAPVTLSQSTCVLNLECNDRRKKTNIG